jgi:hypothetical protein
MLGQSVGLTGEELAAMADAETCATFDATDRLVLRFAEVSTREIRVDDALYAALEARHDRRARSHGEPSARGVPHRP